MGPFKRTKTNSSTLSSADTVVEGESAVIVAQPVNEPGLRVWYEPVNEEVVADVVFIHGLNGDPERTWTAAGAAGPWPKALLPKKLSNVRVLSFGYGSAVVDWVGQFSENRINDHARNLLSALATLRHDTKSTERPIIFVAHSLGGLVCQDALVHSKESAELHLARIEECTRAIAFLGTPLSGSALAKWAERLARSLGLLGIQTNKSITRVLRRDSEVLSRIQDSFQSVLRRRMSTRNFDSTPGHEIDVTCFYEDLPVPRVGEIVPRASATLPGYPEIAIRADHREMARFSSVTSQGFVSVVGELQRWVAKAERVAAEQGERQGPQPEPRTDSSFHSSRISTGGASIYVGSAQSSIIAANFVINGNFTFPAS